MRKSLLFKQNTELFNRINEYENSFNNLKQIIADKDKEIKNLKDENIRLNSKIQSSEPLKALENKVANNTKLDEAFIYGSEIIGKTVIEATKCCNILSEKQFDNSRELINLILGKTEVVKAEILKIVTEETSNDIRKDKMGNIYKESLDYFSGVMKQNI